MTRPPEPDHNRLERERRHDRHLIEAGVESSWGWTTPAGRRRAASRARLIAAAAGLGPGASVLEIGCGTGIFTEAFARTGARILAVMSLKAAHARLCPVSPGRSRRVPLRRRESMRRRAFRRAVVGSSVPSSPAADRVFRRLFGRAARVADRVR